MDLALEQWSFRKMSKLLYTHRIENYCGNSEIRIASPEYRRNSFHKLKLIAEEHGVELRFCRCKNPDVTTENCHQLPTTKNMTTQLMLFQ
jgi:hypothetical protein